MMLPVPPLSTESEPLCVFVRAQGTNPLWKIKRRALVMTNCQANNQNNRVTLISENMYTRTHRNLARRRSNHGRTAP